MNLQRHGGLTRTLVVASALAMSSCGANRGPDLVPTPSVHELARMQQSGLLDQTRLECVIEAAVPMAEEIRASSRVVRDLRESRGARNGHARSVQQGMANSDDADRAARAALDARRVVQQASLRGDHTMAAIYAGFASETLSPARDPGALRQRIWSASSRGAELTDEEAAMFVEYAELRGRVVSDGTSADPAGRAPQIESIAPAVMEFYAGFVLDLYRTEEVGCLGQKP